MYPRNCPDVHLIFTLLDDTGALARVVFFREDVSVGVSVIDAALHAYHHGAPCLAGAGVRARHRPAQGEPDGQRADRPGQDADQRVQSADHGGTTAPAYSPPAEAFIDFLASSIVSTG